MPQPLLCPHDFSPLQAADHEGTVIDTCPVCHGAWLEKGELDLILKTRSPGVPTATPSDLVAQAFDLAEQASMPPIACPSCGTTLDRREFGFASQVRTDVCPSGCGRWLERGEIAELERFYETMNPPPRPLPPFLLALLDRFGL